MKKNLLSMLAPFLLLSLFCSCKMSSPESAKEQIIKDTVHIPLGGTKGNYYEQNYTDGGLCKYANIPNSIRLIKGQ